jgi:hypothetical protein
MWLYKKHEVPIFLPLLLLLLPYAALHKWQDGTVYSLAIWEKTSFCPYLFNPFHK